MNIRDAIDVIESVSGFTDESTPVGEAWAEVLSFIHRPAAQTEPAAPRLVYRYSPVTIAECGGPCEQGPQYCDCGEIKGEPAPEPVAPMDAASRIAHYLEQRRLIRGLDPEVINALHAGTDEPRQAALTVSDLEALTRYARPAIQPVAVSDALIKAELAQWAEQRCAETLAIIRPVMKLHKIRTSEWPP